jgi:hypothetical protein
LLNKKILGNFEDQLFMLGVKVELLVKILAAVCWVTFGFLAYAEDPAPPAFPVEKVEDMREYTLNGLVLSGAEYWVFEAGKDFKYPDDVRWGFQGEQFTNQTPTIAPIAARECALKAYNKLLSFVAQPPEKFMALVRAGATPRFFLWTNDYMAADPAEEMRLNRFWHWNRGPKNYSAGYWKWESTVDKTGVCSIPDDTQIAEMINFVRQAMGLPEF